MRRAVVIEDDSDIRDLIAHSLLGIGLDVTAVDSGLAGVEAVHAVNPDVVTLDLGLPGMDGIEVCRRIRETSDDALVYGGIRVEPAARRASCDGVELLLTRTEFDLLAEMMRNPTRVVSREDLLRAVWGTPWVGGSHVVEVHVGNLRRKLGGARIRTVRGVGYRLEEPAAPD
jgi:DNA-binding response OmpR family regulator